MFQEGLDELSAREEGMPSDAPADGAADAARQAERDAHIKPTWAQRSNFGGDEMHRKPEDDHDEAARSDRERSGASVNA